MFFGILNQGKLEKKQNRYIDREGHVPKKGSTTAKEGISRRDFLKAGVVLGGAVAARKFLKNENNETLEESAKKRDDLAVSAAGEKAPLEVNAYPLEELKAINSFNQPIRFDKQVLQKTREYWKQRYLTKNKSDVSSGLERMVYWKPSLQQVFERYQLPDRMELLALVESYWRMKDVSPKGAAGPFQFMKKTARAYDLQIVDGVYDERYDPGRAAEAFAKNILDVKSKFEKFTSRDDAFLFSLYGYNGGYIWDYFYDRKRKKALGNLSQEDFLSYMADYVNNFSKLLQREQYRMRKGDSWQAVSLQFDVPVEDLLEANKILSQEKELGGKIISIPGMGADKRLSVLRQKISDVVENLSYPEKFLALKELVESGKINSGKHKNRLDLKTQEVKKAGELEYAVQEDDLGIESIRKKLISQLNRNKIEGLIASGNDIINCNNLKILEENGGQKVIIRVGDKLKIPILPKKRSLIDFAEGEEQFLEMLKFINPAVLDETSALPIGAKINLPKNSSSGREAISNAMQLHQKG